jgi:asparagine synthase (glutamine-hydrolysing)
MSFLYGIYHLDRKPILDGYVSAIKQAYQSELIVDKKSYEAAGLLLGYDHIPNTPESVKELQPATHPETDITIVADVRLDNRDELLKNLQIEDSTVGDSHIILEAYLKWGEQCVEHLIGDFVFVIWDGRAERLMMARDQIGIKTGYYYFDKGTLVFATTLPGIASVPDLDYSIDHSWLGHFMTNTNMEDGKTIYRNVKSLLPAKVYVITDAGISSRRYFDFDTEAEVNLPNEEAYIDAFKLHFDRAVTDRLRSAFPIGAELSGGLDSSGINILANRKLRQKGEELTTYSHVMEKEDLGKVPPYIDESEAMQWVIDQEGFKQAHLLTLKGQNPDELKKEYLKRAGQPPVGGHFTLNSLPTYGLAKEAGIRTMLSGHGGDEVVTSYGGGYTLELLGRRTYGKYIRALVDKAHAKQKPALKWTLVQILRDLFPAIFWYWQGKHKKEKLPAYLDLIKPEVRKEMNIEGLVAQSGSWRNMHKTVRERQYYRTKSDHLHSRAERTGILACYEGIEFRYPMLDIRLMQFVLSLPAEMKIKHGWGRYIYRKSMEGILPTGLQWQKEKPSTSIIPSASRMQIDHRRSQVERSSELVSIDALSQMFELRDLTGKLESKTKLDAGEADLYGTLRWLDDWQQSCMTQGDKPN